VRYSFDSTILNRTLPKREVQLAINQELIWVPGCCYQTFFVKQATVGGGIRKF